MIILKEMQDLFKGKLKERFESEILPCFIRGCRWFGGKARQLKRVRIEDAVALEESDIPGAYVLIMNVDYEDNLSEAYLLPIAHAPVKTAENTISKYSSAKISEINVGNSEEIIYDAMYDEKFRKEIIRFIIDNRMAKGRRGDLRGIPTSSLEKTVDSTRVALASRVLDAEQSNTSIVFEDRFILKVIRRLEAGINPELEIGHHLTKLSFPNVPPYLGHIQYVTHHSEPVIVAILQGFVRNKGDAWKLFLNKVEEYFKRILLQRERLPHAPVHSSILDAACVSAEQMDIIGSDCIQLVSLLGKRTGEFHLALARDEGNHEFTPEPFSLKYQSSLSLSMINYADKMLDLTARILSVGKATPNEFGETVEDQGKTVNRSRDLQHTRKGLEEIVKSRDLIKSQFETLQQKKISALRTRIHGDYHLGQVLYTGEDFIIIDYEGEPARSLKERRLKKSPLRDIAGMIRSFHYVPFVYLFEQTTYTPEDTFFLEEWAELWYVCGASVFLKSYLDVVADAGIVPKEEELKELLNSLLLEKAIYELGYELNNRPSWVSVPLRGIKKLLGI